MRQSGHHGHAAEADDLEPKALRNHADAVRTARAGLLQLFDNKPAALATADQRAFSLAMKSAN